MICFFSFDAELSAQKITKSYKDSVKDFFTDFMFVNKHFDSSLILDNPVLLYNKLDSFVLLEENHFRFSIHGTKSYQHKYPTDGWNPIDSISFSKKEIEFFIAQMQKPKLLKWDNEIFPLTTIIRQEKIDSFFTPYWETRNKVSDILRNCHYDTLKCMNDASYRQYKQLRQNVLWRQGFWKFSNPIFLKKGKVAIISYWNYSGDFYVYHSINVYRKKQGHWAYFGYIDSGNFN